VEIEDGSVLACVANDVNVLQVDLESGLSLFADGSFDCVILSRRCRTMPRTEFLLREMLRVGREVIVSFPNFGHWSARLQVRSGRMPVSDACPTSGTRRRTCTTAPSRLRGPLPAPRHPHPRAPRAARGQAVTLIPNLLGSLAVYRCTAG
jgi:hypothetical protein